jgi:hypothetical protein
MITFKFVGLVKAAHCALGLKLYYKGHEYFFCDSLTCHYPCKTPNETEKSLDLSLLADGIPVINTDVFFSYSFYLVITV